MLQDKLEMENFLHEELNDFKITADVITQEDKPPLNTVSTNDFDDNLTSYPHDEVLPACQDQNPYLRANFNWVPKHIWIAPRQYYSYLAIYMTILTSLCCFLNGTVVAATVKNKVLRQPLNYVIVNLAVADLLAGVVGGVISIFANANGYFFWGKFMCQFEGYMVSNFGCTGLNTIAVMAFERYFVVCKPFGNVPFGHRASVIGLVIAWSWAVIWNTPPLLFWDGYDPEGLGTSCAPNWFVKEYGASFILLKSRPRMFIVSYFVFCFIIPYAVIIGCYGGLIINLNKISKQSTVSGSRNPESEVLKMVILMVSAFLFAWLPYAIFAMYNVINPEAQISYGMGALPAFFAKTATLYNPLIYMGFNRQFRDCVIRMFCGGKNPWVEEVVGSQVSSQVTTVSTNKVQPS